MLDVRGLPIEKDPSPGLTESVRPYPGPLDVTMFETDPTTPRVSDMTLFRVPVSGLGRSPLG